MNQLIDTHCHLNFDSFSEDMADVLERAEESGVTRMIIPATDLETSKSALSLTNTRQGLYAAIGLHPNEAQKWLPEMVAEFKEIARHPKVKGIGEIGLDYYRNFSSPEDQHAAFLSQLEMAAALHLPVIIHCRSAFSDLFAMVNEWVNDLSRNGNPLALNPGVFHSFEGNLAEAQQVMDLGFLIGVTGPVTYSNAIERQNTIAAVPLSHLVVETDAPFLTPHPLRGKRNEPEYLTRIVEKIALLKDLPYNTVAEATTKNAATLFKLDE